MVKSTQTFCGVDLKGSFVLVQTLEIPISATFFPFSLNCHYIIYLWTDTMEHNKTIKFIITKLSIAATV